MMMNKMICVGPKHDSLPDALKDLGQPEQISKIFAGFQQYLYTRVA